MELASFLCPVQCLEQLKAYITIAIRLRYDDTTTHSTTTKVIEITIRVRFDCDTATIRLRRKIDMFIFLLESNHVE